MPWSLEDNSVIKERSKQSRNKVARMGVVIGTMIGAVLYGIVDHIGNRTQSSPEQEAINYLDTKIDRKNFKEIDENTYYGCTGGAAHKLGEFKGISPKNMIYFKALTLKCLEESGEKK